MCDFSRSGDQTVEQIAVRCGYRSVSAYSKQFKRLFGMSPSEYRVFFRQVQK